MPALVKLTALPASSPETSHPRPERLLRGNPLRETWNLVTAAQPVGEVDVGVWRCEPGHWRIAFGPHEHELFTVLQGRCRVHNDEGGSETVEVGEALYIPPGFRGAFEVLAHLTKTYMICNAPPVATAPRTAGADEAAGGITPGAPAASTPA